MKILILSWEYPPVVIGGLGRHVHHLSVALAQAGHDIVVLTRHPAHTDACTHPLTDQIREGVRVITSPEDPHDFSFEHDMMAWTLAMGHSMIRAGLTLSNHSLSQWCPDRVHAHDWLVAHPAIALADFYNVPLIATIHATEAGRHSGWISGQISRQVHAIESWLVRQSDQIITCSTSMHDEVNQLFGPHLCPINIIPNGINAHHWPFALRTRRQGPAELLYVGRLEYEKGVHDLIGALPRIQARHPGTRLTIAGDGTQQNWLMTCAQQHRVASDVHFLGRVDHAELLHLLHRADVAVLPSHYEPFGLAALEAAATGIPLATSDVGGLGEAVIPGQTGVSYPPHDIDALARAVCEVLDDPISAQNRAIAARNRLTCDFDWTTIAQRTSEVYENAYRRQRDPVGRLPIMERPLPDRSVE